MKFIFLVCVLIYGDALANKNMHQEKINFGEDYDKLKLKNKNEYKGFACYINRKKPFKLIIVNTGSSSISALNLTVRDSEGFNSSLNINTTVGSLIMVDLKADYTSFNWALGWVDVLSVETK